MSAARPSRERAPAPVADACARAVFSGACRQNRAPLRMRAVLLSSCAMPFAPSRDIVLVHSSDLHMDHDYTARLHGGDGTAGLSGVLSAARAAARRRARRRYLRFP